MSGIFQAGQVPDTAPHDEIGIDPDASPGDVRDAWRERVKEAHPDQGGSEEELQRVHDAKEVLLDEE